MVTIKGEGGEPSSCFSKMMPVRSTHLRFEALHEYGGNFISNIHGGKIGTPIQVVGDLFSIFGILVYPDSCMS